MSIPDHEPHWAETLSSGLVVASPRFCELRGEPLVALEHPAQPRPAPDRADGGLRRVRPGYLIGKHVDLDASGEVDGDDPWRWFVYDERWRVIAAYRGTATTVEADAKERFVHHAAE